MYDPFLLFCREEQYIRDIVRFLNLKGVLWPVSGRKLIKNE